MNVFILIIFLASMVLPLACQDSGDSKKQDEDDPGAQVTSESIDYKFKINWLRIVDGALVNLTSTDGAEAFAYHYSTEETLQCEGLEYNVKKAGHDITLSTNGYSPFDLVMGICIIGAAQDSNGKLVWEHKSKADKFQWNYPAKGTGLLGTYFSDIYLTSEETRRIDAAINFKWGENAPDAFVTAPESFSVRWKGIIQADFSEVYKFMTRSDDGVRLWIDGQMIISSWQNDDSVQENVGEITLEKGVKYPITLEYFDIGSSAEISLSWESESQEKEIVPKNRLFPKGSDKAL